MRFLIVSAGVLVLTSQLLAQEERPRPQNPPDLDRLFERFDKNNDGFLDKDEAPERIKERFDQLDENKDGKLSRDEVRKMLERMAANRPGAQPASGPAPSSVPEPLFRALDTDGDGRLSKDELLAAVKLLEKLDRNRDGFVDRTELSLPGGAPAPETGRRIVELFERLDLDKNGKLSRDEAKGPLAEIFERADQNKDGAIDKDEFRRVADRLMPPGGTPPGQGDVARRIVEMFQRLDANNDGKISKDEAKGPLLEGFERFDANGDGFIDKDEARRALERLAQTAPPPDRPRPGDAPRPGGSFDDLDKNADGRLTREEVKGTPLADKFDEIDANKDGKIDPKELEAFRNKK
jgi:collagen type III alpha